MSKRLFIAIPISPETQNRIINSIRLPSSFRITKEENLHITLLFLGEVEEPIIPEITTNLENAISSFKSFDLDLTSYGQFPYTGSPKIIYLAGSKNEKKLTALAESVRKEMKKQGFYDNKKFRNHLTVARPKSKVNPDFVLPLLYEPINFSADRVTLFSSQLTPKGPIYMPIWEQEI